MTPLGIIVLVFMGVLVILLLTNRGNADEDTLDG
jgi:hypothetical protein